MYIHHEYVYCPHAKYHNFYTISISVGTLNEVQFPIEVIFALIAGTVVSAFAYMIIHSCLKKHRFKKQPPKGTCLIASIIVTVRNYYFVLFSCRKH